MDERGGAKSSLNGPRGQTLSRRAARAVETPGDGGEFEAQADAPLGHQAVARAEVITAIVQRPDRLRRVVAVCARGGVGLQRGAGLGP
jgi:hypothetical protein